MKRYSNYLPALVMPKPEAIARLPAKLSSISEPVGKLIGAMLPEIAILYVIYTNIHTSSDDTFIQKSMYQLRSCNTYTNVYICILRITGQRSFCNQCEQSVSNKM